MYKNLQRFRSISSNILLSSFKITSRKIQSGTSATHPDIDKEIRPRESYFIQRAFDVIKGYSEYRNVKRPLQLTAALKTSYAYNEV